MRVAYFTVVPFHVAASGGVLCALNHVQRLVEDGLEVSVFQCTDERVIEASRELVEQRGAEYVAEPWRWDTRAMRRSRRRHPVAFQWPFQYERLSLWQGHIDGAVQSWLRRFRPEVTIVEYVPSALFAPSLYRNHRPVVTITQNWEAGLYREMRATRSLIPETSGSWLANARLRRFERRVYRSSEAVVALTENDLRMLGDRPRIREVMPPALDPRPERWTGAGGRRLLFVGSALHHPNRMAIEWLATDLAPELRAVDPGVEIRIVGADEDSVPYGWRQKNVTYLGSGDSELLAREQTEAALFVAPIANNVGAKIKLLTCLAYGTPFLATAAAESGLAFVSGPTGRIHLDRPADAATLAVDLLERPDALEESSLRLSSELDTFIERRRGAWSALLRRVVSNG